MFREHIVSWKVLIFVFYHIAADTISLKKFIAKLQIFEVIRTIFVWTDAEIVWRLVGLNQWHISGF